MIIEGYTKEEISRAMYIAYGHLYSWYYLKSGRSLEYDGRTRIGKLANNIFQKVKLEVDRKHTLELQENRRGNKYTFSNILDNPLVRDLLANKRDVKHWDKTRVVFWGGRNHWAKSEKDIKIIDIFRRGFEARTNSKN